jgi:hypothetical protein
MKNVFSFSLFGSAQKYSKGLLENVHIINKYFPEWHTYIWIGDGVSEDILVELHEQKNVKLIGTNEEGLVNMSYRFFSIDDPEVQIMCVRDADSRINARDRACIEEFVNSEKLFHIIRDHPNHHHTIMGGMWGMKKGLIDRKLQDAFQEWRMRNKATEFWNDMDFLRSLFYPFCVPYAMIHDEIQHFEPQEWLTPFSVPLDDAKQHFIGQVYEFDTDGKEYPKYPYEKGN